MRVTTFVNNGRTFEIVFDQNYYLAIEDKYIDANGCLTTELNGLQMMASETLGECLENVKMACKRDELIASGMNKHVAAMVAPGMDIETAEAMVKDVEAY